MDAPLIAGGAGPIHAQALSKGRPSCTRQQIITVAIRLFREIGHRKTTVLDIAQATSMSPANVYRFFGSKHEIEEAVIAELLGEILNAANSAARNGGSAIHRLEAVLRVISRLHERRLERDMKLHELVVAAMRQNWSVTRSFAERIIGILRPIVAVGQDNGELRPGDAMTLTCCLLNGMQAHLDPLLFRVPGGRPTFAEMLDFCIGALRLATSSQGPDIGYSSHLGPALQIAD